MNTLSSLLKFIGDTIGAAPSTLTTTSKTLVGAINEIDNDVSGLLDVFYPVGSYYETDNSNFDPNTAWGGTWTSETLKNDFIIEEGKSNDWTYRKWSSGIAECWGEKHFTFSTNSGWGSVFYETPYNDWAFPTNLFSASPAAALSRTNNVEGFVGMAGVTKNGIGGMYLMRPTESAAGSYDVSCYAKGQWKTYIAPTTQYRWHRIA